ncbi:MAG: hypothetical protein ACI8Z5_000493 [Lentimonas sp.]|jgi:hypothetical protein
MANSANSKYVKLSVLFSVLGWGSFINSIQFGRRSWKPRNGLLSTWECNQLQSSGAIFISFILLSLRPLALGFVEADCCGCCDIERIGPAGHRYADARFGLFEPIVGQAVAFAAE